MLNSTRLEVNSYRVSAFTILAPMRMLLDDFLESLLCRTSDFTSYDPERVLYLVPFNHNRRVPIHCTVYRRLLRLMDSGRINMESMSQQSSSSFPSVERMKFTLTKSMGFGPMRRRAVKKAFLPS